MTDVTSQEAQRGEFAVTGDRKLTALVVRSPQDAGLEEREGPVPGPGRC